jgi:hypothetical protein
MNKLENLVNHHINTKVEKALKKNPWGKWWLNPSLITAKLPVFGRVMHMLLSINRGERHFNLLRSSRMSAREIEQGLCLGLIVRITIDLAHPLYYNTPRGGAAVAQNSHHYSEDKLHHIEFKSEHMHLSDFENSKIQLFKYSITPSTSVKVRPNKTWQMHFRDHSW